MVPEILLYGLEFIWFGIDGSGSCIHTITTSNIVTILIIMSIMIILLRLMIIIIAIIIAAANLYK